jgi:Uma2 family endonuclease
MAHTVTPSTHGDIESTSQADPFRYGWRYVPHVLPNGTTTFDQIPLTLEDVLHPEEGDFIVQNEPHNRLCIYLFNVLRARVANDPAALVLSDCRIAWDVPGLRPFGPDIAVIFGVREHRGWSTFNVEEEGTRPALVIEVTSPDTWHLDLDDKLDGYERAGVPLYVIADIVPRRGQQIPRLLGYHETPTGYVPLAPDERGWLWLEAVQLWLGIEESQVWLYDATGRRIGDYTDLAIANVEAEARIRELEEELRRLRDRG